MDVARAVVMAFTLMTILQSVKSVTVLNCLECHEVTSPDLCETWAKCGQEEMCFTRQFRNQHGAMVYHMGCEDKQTCDIYNHVDELVHILGRRSDDVSSRLCRECCSQNNCNSRLCNNKPTNASACPPAYQGFRDKCYYISNTLNNWEDARGLCFIRGGDLVSINTKDEQDFLASILQKRNGSSTPDAYWTGGFFNLTAQDYQWMDGSLVNFSVWGPFQPTVHRDANHYKIDMKNPSKHAPYIGWAWSFDDHLYKSGFVCEMPQSV